MAWILFICRTTEPTLDRTTFPMPTPPVTSRAALAELARQRALLTATLPRHVTSVTASEDRRDERRPRDREEEKGGKGAGRKHDVQRDPEDQKGKADPKDGEGRGAP